MSKGPLQDVTARYNTRLPVAPAFGAAEQPTLAYNTARNRLPPLPTPDRSILQTDHSATQALTPTGTNRTSANANATSTCDAYEHHYSQLIAYYWHYAQQGWLAPVINGDPVQHRARNEAANWARANGICPIEPAQSTVQLADPRTESHTSTSSLSRPLPRPPLSVASGIERYSSAAIPNTAVDQPTNTGEQGTVSHLSRSGTGRRPLPQTPAKADKSPLASDSSAVDVLGSKLQHVTLSSTSTSSSDPHGNETEDTLVPTFAFSLDEGSEVDVDRDVIAPPLPELNIVQDSKSLMDGKPEMSNLSPPTPRVHPRFDPSHPSHFLYHPKSTPSTLEAGTISCAGCQQTMFGRALIAMGSTWHPGCFRCIEPGCGQLLEHVQFDGQDDQVYCMVHYEEHFVDQCYHCKTPIADAEFIKIQDPLLLPPFPVRTYHALHFFCSDCGDPFVDPTLLAKGQLQHTLAKPYIVHKGYAYCEECDIKLYRPKCRGCRKGVRDEWVELEAGQVVFHPDCFVCDTCCKPLSSTYLVRTVPAESQNGRQGDKIESVERVYCVACFDDEAETGTPLRRSTFTTLKEDFSACTETTMDRLPLEVRLRLAFFVEQTDIQQASSEGQQAPLLNVLNLARVSKDWNFACRSRLFRELRMKLQKGDLEVFTPSLAQQVGTHVRYIACAFDDANGDMSSPSFQGTLLRGQCAFSAALKHCTKVEALGIEVGYFDDHETAKTFDEPLLTAVKTFPNTLQNLNIVSMYQGEPTVSMNPRTLATYLRAFNNLRELCIIGVGRGTIADETYFLKTLARMKHLESLTLSDCDCLGPRMTRVIWDCPIDSLSIKRCNRVDLVDIEELSQQFKTTLKDLTIHHFAPLDDESIARFDHLSRLQTLELESVFPILHLRCFIPCHQTLEHIKLGTALRPWQDEDGEGQIFTSVLECLRPGLKRFELLQGYETWGQQICRQVAAWCDSRSVDFHVGEDEPFSEFEEDEEDDYMSEGF
ncbi:hypothetical protein OIV83_004815 [Microbotryomycetes sp. JL201]|nr:hypothetical protein OIV83_004815 [Microbotryomycetes sp. JL201]